MTDRRVPAPVVHLFSPVQDGTQVSGSIGPSRSGQARRRRSAGRLLLGAMAVAAAGVHAGEAAAASRNWTCVGASANWNTPACWSGGALPAASDNVLLSAGGWVSLNLPTPSLFEINLSGGTLQLQTGGALSARRQFANAGSVLHSGGSNTTLDSQTVGGDSTRPAQYVQTGGSNTTPILLVGSNGSLNVYATYAHSGGTNSAGTLYVGYAANNDAAYALSGTAVLSSTDQFVGRADTARGRFTQAGGTNTVAGTLYLGPGTESGAVGHYALSDGILSAQAIDVRSRGTLLQTGGTSTVAGTLSIGPGTGGGTTGGYTLANGSLSAQSIVLRTGGTLHHAGGTLTAGTVTQATGTFVAEGTLAIGGSGAIGTYTLGGGVLSARQVHLRDGGTLTVNANTLTADTVIQDGGTHSQPGDFLVRGASFASNSVGTYVLNDGIFSVRGNLAINGIGTSLVQTGGSLSAKTANVGTTGAVTQSGGTFRAAVVNQGLYAASGGSVVGDMSHSGRMTLAGDFRLDGHLTISGSGTIGAAAGARLTVTGNVAGETRTVAGWDTSGATLSFEAGARGSRHSLELFGQDRGADAAGYADNFAWGGLALGAGQTLSVVDAKPGAGPNPAALYVGAFQLLDYAGGDPAGLIDAGVDSAFNIYYDAANPANRYLGGRDFSLGAEGGRLLAVGTLPVPEPATWATLLAGLGLLGGVARRRGARL